MKNPFLTTDTVKSLTLKLSLAEGTTIADVRGKRYRLTLPMNGLSFDNHGGLSAYFYALFLPQLGNGSTPAPAGLTLYPTGNNALYGSDATNARLSILSRLVFELQIASDAAAFEDIPLILKGYNRATEMPAATLPEFEATPDSPFAVTDLDGGAVLIGWQEIAAATGGSGVVTTEVLSAESQTLTYTDVPADHEHALRATGTTETFTFKPTTSNAALGTGIGALAAYAQTVTVTGALSTSTDADTGETLYSGVLTVRFESGDVPQLEVLAAEKQNWTVTGGDSDADYKPHTGATARALGQTEAQIQTDLRALSGDFAAVVVKGESAAPAAGTDIIVSGAGDAATNGTYSPNGTQEGKPRYLHTDADHRIVWNDTNAAWFMDTVGGASATYKTHDADLSGSRPPTTGWETMFGAAPVPTVAYSAGAAGEADFNIYFPYSEGNVSQIVPEGTGSAASTVIDGGAAATGIIENTTQEGGAVVLEYTDDFATKIPELADDDAPNLIQYWSIDRSKFCIKNPSGAVVELT